MNLRDLRYVVAVDELRSFVQAAEQCCISQPTLSTQIKKMEDDLGVQIFERSNKQVFPTETGKLIVTSAKRILGDIDYINDVALLSRDPLSGDFRLGAFPTLSTYIFPDLVPVVQQHLPKLRLILIEEKTDKLVGMLKQGQLDAALLALPVNDEECLQAQPIFKDAFKLAVSTDNPLANKKVISDSDLQQQQLLLLDEGHCLRDHALQICHSHGANELKDVRATGLETLRQMVKAGTGITFFPEIAVRENEDGICYLPLSEPVPSRTIGLVWRKTAIKKQLIEKFISLIKEIQCCA